MVSTPYVGLGEFCRQIGLHLGHRAAELRSVYGIEFYFLVPPKFKGCFGGEVKYIGVPPLMRGVLRLLPISADLYHIPHQSNHVKRFVNAKKQLLTIHDINFIYEKSGDKLRKNIEKLQHKINKSDYLCFISNFALDDTLKHFHIKQHCRVIHNGATNLAAVPHLSPLPPSVPENYLFHISSLQPKKNVRLLVEMMEYLPDYNLVIAGCWDSPYGRELRQLIKDNNIKNIVTLPNVTEEEKASLYAACRAFLFPSLCEGFGLPPIEAMNFGKPVFLSTLTALPEIGGDVAFYWDELSPKAMAEEVRKQMGAFDAIPAYQQKIKENAARFTWENCVDQYIK